MELIDGEAKVEPLDLTPIVEMNIGRVARRLGIGDGHPDRPDLGQRCWELALRHAERIARHPVPGALVATIFRRLDRDHSWRNTGWALSEWDARSLFTARQDVLADRPHAVRDEIDADARDRFTEDGHDAAVYDVVIHDQLSLFKMVQLSNDEGDPVLLVDTIPDATTITSDDHFVQASFEDFLNDDLDDDAGLVLELHLAGLTIAEINEALDLGSYWTTRRILNGAIDNAREWAGFHLGEEAATEDVADVA